MKIDLLDQQLAASVRGDIEEAWRMAQILERERPHDRRAAFNRGWHLLRLGDLKRGFELLENGRFEGVYGSTLLKTEKPRWSGKEDLQGKTILLRGEGGFGDEIINIRFAQELSKRGARVLASVSDGIVSVLSRATGVERVIPHREIDENDFDYWLPAMSAPFALDLTYKDLSGESYLSADSAYLEKWSALLRQSYEGQRSPALRVGLRWSGNPKFEHEQHRRFPPEPMFAWKDIPNVHLYSLQRDNDLRDLPEEITDLQHEMKTWEDTAAAIANLDLIVTSCTAVAHLAAAMGKETWVIVPILPYQVWARPGDRSQWYKSVRLFRQEVFENWDQPFAKLGGALAEVAKQHSGRTVDASSTRPVHRSETPLSNSATTRFAESSGIYLAPKPQGAHDAGRRMHSNSTLHFVAGLPRTGATALMSLFAQNSRFHSAPVSGLASIFAGVHANWDKSEFHIELPNSEAKRRTLRAILEHYHATDRPVVLDKDRHWMSLIQLIEQILERPIKLIIPVRPIPEIIASFEAIRRKHALEFTGADEALGPSSTIASRAAYYADGKGPLGLAYNAMKDAVTQGYLDRMLFVDYNKLMSAPKTQLTRIYEFLEEPYFEHDLGRIEQVAQYNWRPHKLPGLHDVRSEFKKDFKPARQILGDVYAQYDQPEPWAAWT